MMYTIDNEYVFEQTINRSIFICTLCPIKSAEDAQYILNTIRKKYYDANHNCYAYIIGEHGESGKNSDDGEPSQTAGIVIYNVLKKNNLTNIIAVVTRYFGGIKLGTGGLIRAYSSSTSQAIQISKLLKIEKCSVIKLTFSYQLLNLVSKLLVDYKEVEKNFQDNITTTYLIPIAKKDEIVELLISSTKNQIKIEFMGEMNINV